MSTSDQLTLLVYPLYALNAFSFQCQRLSSHWSVRFIPASHWLLFHLPPPPPPHSSSAIFLVAEIVVTQSIFLILWAENRVWRRKRKWDVVLCVETLVLWCREFCFRGATYTTVYLSTLRTLNNTTFIKTLSYRQRLVNQTHFVSEPVGAEIFWVKTLS